MSYTNDDVKVGRELVAHIGRSQWALGDLALKVAPIGVNHAHNGTMDIIAAFSEEIGADPDSLRQWRWVSAAWPHGARVASASYTLHRELANNPRRVELMGEYLAQTDKPSSRGLQAFLGKRPTTQFAKGDRAEQVRQGLAEMDPAERAEVVRGALADETTATQVMADPATARSVVDAAPAAISQAQVQRERDRVRDFTDGLPDGARESNQRLGQAGAAADLQLVVSAYTDAARTFAASIAALLPQLSAYAGGDGPLTLHSAAGRARDGHDSAGTALAALESYVQGGAGLDDELARMLDGRR